MGQKKRPDALLVLCVAMLVALTVFVGGVVAMNSHDDNVTITLDARHSEIARRCWEFGFAVNVWTDETRARASCTAAY